MSVKPSERSSCSATYCGAMQIAGYLVRRTAVVSRAASAASTRGARTRLPAPASDNAVKKWRRVCFISTAKPPFPCSSRLQLAFDLVEKAPIGAVGDDLLRARFYETRLAHAQRVEPQRILGVVF